MRRTHIVLVFWLALAGTVRLCEAQTPRAFPDRVEIRRTSYGVPHILADDLAAAAYGLAWVQLEDYGLPVVVNLLRGRGELARYFGRDSIESDFAFRRSHARAVETFHTLMPETRAVMEGFAAGVNRYVALHPREFATFSLPEFTAHDVAALWVDETVEPATRTFRRAQGRRRSARDSLAGLGAGSNAWAFAPSRTRSGNAILLRNPHLNWGAGYYEAQVTVPGVINFYGDFRIGYPLYFNGGFNEQLGWATTNNYPDLEEVYALDVDPAQADHYRFDGGSVPMERVEVAVEWRNGPGLSTETREYFDTPLGPVIDRGEGKIYVLRSPGWGEYRKAEQFLRMMRARNLEEWKAAVRMRAHTESNLTYADRDGNIYYVWNGTVPRYPRMPAGDTAATPASSTADVWTEITAFDSMPQLLDPRGGYLQNANDPFHFTNLNAVMDSTAFPAYFPRPELGFRSQLSLDLVGGRGKVSLEDVVRMKHTYRMLTAERFKDDLVAVVRASGPAGGIAQALQVLEAWDNTVSPDARGGVLFEAWFRRYTAADSGDTRPAAERWKTLFADPWDPERPVTTPDGLADSARAMRALETAINAVEARFGRVDPAWGETHRVRLGNVDAPVGGCHGGLGCFRVLWFEDAPDGTYTVSGGDGWVLAVEFGNRGPRAYSVLAYGESAKPDSPHHADQAEMFARAELKRVAFTEEEIVRDLVRRYRPGGE
jgi:acyl-homoserine-lactone acylase